MKFNEHIKIILEADEDPAKTGSETVFRGFDPNIDKGPGNTPILTKSGLSKTAKGAGNVGGQDDSHIAILNHNQYRTILEKCIKSKQATLMFGRPGLGKSAQVKAVAEEMASFREGDQLVFKPNLGEKENRKWLYPKKSDPTQHREFSMFTGEDPEHQQKIMQNPGDYFLLIDVRAASLEPTDFMGIPVFDEETGETNVQGKPKEAKQKELLRTTKYKWAWLATNEDVSGFLFFDELNQAEPNVLGAMYAIVLDRTIFDAPISENIGLVAAGNLAEDDPVAANLPLPHALSRRFKKGVFSLYVSPDEWLKWAESKKVHPTILSFVMADKKNFYQSPGEGEKINRFADPDSMVALSKFLYNADKRYFASSRASGFSYNELLKEYDHLARSVVGSTWATKFIAYLAEANAKEFKESGSKLTAAEKWRNIHVAQQLFKRVLSTDPTLKDPKNKSSIKYLSGWLTSQDNTVKQMVSDGLHRNTETGEAFKQLKIRMTEPDFENIKPDSGIIDNFNSGGFISEHEKNVFTDEDTATNLLTVNHKNFEKNLEYAWESKESLLVYGDPGIGKSWAIRKLAERKAEEVGLPFVSVMQLNRKDKAEVIKDPSKFFLFVDVRLAQVAPSDFMGIPQVFNHQNAEYLTTAKYLWAWLVTRKNTQGVLLFDEINQAETQVLKAIYSIVNSADRFIFDVKLSPGILVIGAANLASQDTTARKSDVPQALNRRFKAGTVVLKMDAKEWLKWAKSRHGTKDEIHPTILEFISTRPNPDNYIFRKAPTENTADLTPDTLKSLSENLRENEERFNEREKYNMNIDDNIRTYIDELRVSVAHNIEWGNEFLDFLYKKKYMDWDLMMKNKHLYANPRALSSGKVKDESGQSIGDSALGQLYAWIPFSVELIQKVLNTDKELNKPIMLQRVTELLDFFSNMHDQYATAYFTYIKRLGSEDLFKYFVTLMLTNPKIPADIKAKASKKFEIAKNNSIKAMGAK
jgi:MoxR-like ATPase